MYDLNKPTDIEAEYKRAKEARSGVINAPHLEQLIETLGQYYFDRGYWAGRKGIVEAARAIVAVKNENP